MTWIVLPLFFQAGAQDTALSEVMEVNLKTLLVTKEDLMHEVVELLRRDMRDMEQCSIIELCALMVFSIGVVAALVKLL